MANPEADPAPTTTLRSISSRTMTMTDGAPPPPADASVDRHHDYRRQPALSRHRCNCSTPTQMSHHPHRTPGQLQRQPVSRSPPFTVVLGAPRTHQMYTADHAMLALGSTKASESSPPYDPAIPRGRPPRMLSTTAPHQMTSIENGHTRDDHTKSKVSNR